MWLRGRQCGKLTALLGQKDRSLGFGPVLVEELGEFDEKLRPRVRPYIYTHFISPTYLIVGERRSHCDLSCDHVGSQAVGLKSYGCRRRRCGARTDLISQHFPTLDTALSSLVNFVRLVKK